jgi:carboxymethylenebutenolidase
MKRSSAPCANDSRHNIEHEIVIYPGAPHSFFHRRAREFADTSADARRRVLGFIAAHTA